MPALCADVLLLISREIACADRQSFRAASKDFSFTVSPSFFKSTAIILDLPRMMDNPTQLDVGSSSGWSQFGRTLVIRSLRGEETKSGSDLVKTPLTDFLTSLKELRSIHWTLVNGDLEWAYQTVQSAFASFSKLENLTIIDKRTSDMPIDLTKMLLAAPLTNLRSLNLAKHVKAPAHYNPALFAELWSALAERGVQLTSLEVPTPDSALLDYLASYSSLESLMFSAGDDDAMADRFFAEILPNHATTLLSFICSARKRYQPPCGANWTFSRRNATAISNLKNLHTLEMSVPEYDPEVDYVSMLIEAATTHLPALRVFAVLGSTYIWRRRRCVRYGGDEKRDCKPVRRYRDIQATVDDYALAHEGDPEVSRLVASHRARIEVRRRASFTEMWG
ncbi:hypothetical protein FB45DRAFT_1137933 [Roridomyces roridus]|uniref:Uncharacterized protein n=1 Tax=Roridomyces roridus TaxID=1738132 RepID=A0AAD7C0P9_9AGAR|nr:hypothetical protein FB45DRAFT_1137933 [Roridomyces roridus]